MASEEELQGIKTLLLSDNRTNHLIAIQLMKGLGVSPRDAVGLITTDDFVGIESSLLFVPTKHMIDGYGMHNYSYTFDSKNKLQKLIECQTKSQNYLINLINK